MVKKRLIFAALAFLLVFSAAAITVANAQTRVYRFNQEWAKIWINEDGTIDLFYNVSLTVVSGQSISWVRLGMPNGDFQVGESKDQYGHILNAYDDSDGSNYRARITLYTPLTAGNTIWFTLITNVGHMFTADTQNEGNVGMQFAPQWFEEVPISDVRVQIVFPTNVTVNDVKTNDKFWNSSSTESDGKLALYWEKPLLQVNERYIIGVSFPASALPSYTAPPKDQGISIVTIAIIIGALIFAIIIVAVIISAVRKRTYQPPKVSMETLGARRGLTAVEASYLLNLKPTQIVTEILYSLLQKRAAWVEATTPALKLKIMPEFQNKKGADDNPLRYYEIDFLEAIKKDGALDEEKLAKTIMFLRDTLEEKLRGYSRKDTVDYYRKIVDKAWSQVDQAGTADLASKAYDEQLLWLLLDPNYKGRTETSFQTRVFQPNPLWFWYWYGYTHYHPHPTTQPIPGPPSPTAKPQSLPGADFANNIATSVEKTSNNIVGNLEKFANAIVPPPPQAKASHQPARQGADCVCACAACACACACVSCACACAGGGVG